MKNLIYILFGCILSVIWYGCQKDNHATDFKNFLDGHEIVYTGAVGTTIIQPGNLEVALKWKASTDPTIVKYVVYYNNKADSQVVKIAGKTDTVRTVIKGLSEYTYSFTIFSYDAKGNKSIPTEVNNVKVYGPVYTSKLLNRGYDAVNPYVLNNDGSVLLNFITPDTINIKTIIKYTNVAGVASTVTLLPANNSITLPSFKVGSAIQYQSSYIPEKGAIDTFTVASFSTFPKVYSYVQCDKSLFKELHLPNDAGAYESGTSISKLWDGSVGPQDYPNIFHSDGSQKLPHCITFDMGKLYDNLGRIEETGRKEGVNDKYHNPLDFQVWGTADITNAATTLLSSDPGWEAEAKAKGWVLLKECLRTDDGQAPTKFDLTSTTSVRYIRIRVMKVYSGNDSYSNMSELTFWNKQ
ncbi:MAG: hypothetical protein JWR38_2102 [Mucilaginibacter sp.]|nr:hypothetical protein [Mucilaginibacter sp.]